MLPQDDSLPAAAWAGDEAPRDVRRRRPPKQPVTSPFGSSDSSLPHKRNVSPLPNHQRLPVRYIATPTIEDTLPSIGTSMGVPDSALQSLLTPSQANRLPQPDNSRRLPSGPRVSRPAIATTNGPRHPPLGLIPPPPSHSDDEERDSVYRRYGPYGSSQKSGRVVTAYVAEHGSPRRKRDIDIVINVTKRPESEGCAEVEGTEESVDEWHDEPGWYGSRLPQADTWAGWLLAMCLLVADFLSDAILFAVRCVAVPPPPDAGAAQRQRSLPSSDLAAKLAAHRLRDGFFGPGVWPRDMSPFRTHVSPEATVAAGHLKRT
ncbi:hypothetical protein DIPPA_16221 [Diplonema papillatum]|nr:hypothetical protein DIPPA_16221 [Diplonema papillatum]